MKCRELYFDISSITALREDTWDKGRTWLDSAECSPSLLQLWRLGEERQLKREKRIFREPLQLCKELTAWEQQEMKSSTLIFWPQTSTPPLLSGHGGWFHQPQTEQP